MHQNPSTRGTGRFAFAAVIVANLFLAAGPWMVRVADVGPVASGFWRLALAVPFLAALGLWRGGARSFRAGPALLGAVVLGGVFFAADLAAWHEGIVRTKLANSTLFGNMSSFLFAAYGFLLARRLPPPLQAGALLLAGLGAALLLGGSYELSQRNFAGDLLCLLAAVFYGLYLMVVDQARRTMAPLPLLAISSAAGAVPMLVLALALGQPVLPGEWTPMILLALGSQVIGQGLIVYAVGHLSPVVVGIGLLTQPVAASALGWVVYGEGLTLLDGLGALLIAAAMVLIRLRPEEAQLRGATSASLASSPREDH
ncbi:MAG TPA: DMT family transporter [Allosphingosinicella sp.]|jgi:drug/metabolite transporter (DMT)-like permease|nr:DMT family transporter [Allosphingosinicella sp.]